MVCGEQHNKTECKSNYYKCALCNGPHKANDKSCSYVSKAREVEKRKANGERHLEAISNVRAQKQVETRELNSQNSGNVIVTRAEVHHAMNSQVNERSYSNALQAQRKITDNKIEKEIKTVQIKQKQLEVDIKQTIERVIEQQISKLVTKITECIVEIFCSSVLKESDKNKKLVIQNIMQNHLPLEREKVNDTHDEINIEQPNEELSDEDMQVLSDGELSSDSIDSLNKEGNQTKKIKRKRKKSNEKTEEHIKSQSKKKKDKK